MQKIESADPAAVLDHTQACLSCYARLRQMPRAASLPEVASAMYAIARTVFACQSWVGGER